MVMCDRGGEERGEHWVRSHDDWVGKSYIIQDETFKRPNHESVLQLSHKCPGVINCKQNKHPLSSYQDGQHVHILYRATKGWGSAVASLGPECDHEFMEPDTSKYLLFWFSSSALSVPSCKCGWSLFM